MENFVSVTSYPDEIEARLAQATLAAAGIESYLKFEDTGGMMPVLQQIIGVKVLVHENDVEEAKTLLSTTAEEQTEL